MTAINTEVTSPQLRKKHPLAGMTYYADFANQLNGQTIASAGSISQVIDSTNAAPATPDLLTIGAASISGTQIVFKVSAGTDGTVYAILVPVTTNTGDTLVMRCLLQVAAR